MPYIRQLLKDRHFLKIIDHPNYNPRVIEFMTALERVETIDADHYISSFVRLLIIPQRYGNTLFNHQLSLSARNLLLTLRTFTTTLLLNSLKLLSWPFIQNGP